jgi:hypothetical protein
MKSRKLKNDGDRSDRTDSFSLLSLLSTPFYIIILKQKRITMNDIREYLVNLLFEEFKQYLLIDKLYEIGIYVEKIRLNNWKIVIAILSFPKEISPIYHFIPIEDGAETLHGKNQPNGDLFNCDLYCNKYFEFVEDLAQKQLKRMQNGRWDLRNSDYVEVKKELGLYLDSLYKSIESDRLRKHYKLCRCPKGKGDKQKVTLAVQES